MVDSPLHHQNEDPRVRRVEIIISTILRVGVVTSLFVVVLGTALSFVHHPDYRLSHNELDRLTHPGAAFPHTPAQVRDGIVHLRGQSIVVLGLLILLATPVLRVAISVLAFLYQRDRIFVIITLIVLTLLLLSFFLGKVE